MTYNFFTELQGVTAFQQGVLTSCKKTLFSTSGFNKGFLTPCNL